MTIPSVGKRAFLVIAPAFIVFSTVFGGVAGAQSIVSVGDVRVVEGDSGPRSVDIMVGLSQAAKAAITVAYATKDGTATAGADYVAANGAVSFTAGEFVKRITIQIVGETATEGDETFDVILGPATGATISSGTAKVTIVSDDLPPSGLAVYEVRFSFVGSTGSMEGAAGCPVRNNGRVEMTGLLSGNDKVKSDEDIVYRGVLDYTADVDMCDVRNDGGGDNAKLCSITLEGAGPINVELTISEGDRGGYVKVSRAPGNWLRNALGSCDPQMLADELKMFPNDSQGTIFNGHDLVLKSGPLQPTPRPPQGQTPPRVGGVLFEVLRVVRR